MINRGAICNHLKYLQSQSQDESTSHNRQFKYHDRLGIVGIVLVLRHIPIGLFATSNIQGDAR